MLRVLDIIRKSIHCIISPIPIRSEDLKITHRSTIMGRVEVWDTLPSFKMLPSKTFFGLDRSEAHCFTLPKQMTNSLIQFFGLREGKLQCPITLIISGEPYPAMIRWARLDRSNPNKLKKEDLPKRDIIQFGWKGCEETISAIRFILQDAFQTVISGGKNQSHSAIFVHRRNDEFDVFSSND